LFQHLGGDDIPLLADWFGRPHVETWWREPSDPASVEAAYGPMVDGTDPTEGFPVLLEGRSVGFNQCYRITDDPDWKHAVTGVIGTVGSDAAIGIDYLIGDPTLTGQGLGRRMIRVRRRLVGPPPARRHRGGGGPT
jgi:aminoglycoside 6'-N-acetyltransferase